MASNHTSVASESTASTRDFVSLEDHVVDTEYQGVNWKKKHRPADAQVIGHPSLDLEKQKKINRSKAVISKQNSMNYDAKSNVSDTSRMSAEPNIEEIKARTMYKMVEDMGNGKHLLFLTSAQADLLATTPGSIKRVLEAFDIPPPKLVIQFVLSPGTEGWIEQQIETTRDRKLRAEQSGEWDPRSPVVDYPWPQGRFDSLQAEHKLMRFMEQTILPLAIATNAVIMCTPLLGGCMLAHAFGRVLKQQSAKWGRQPPFSTICCTSQMASIYSYQKSDATWLEYMNNSVTWRKRHARLASLYVKSEAYRAYDLDASFPNVIVCDSVQESNRGWKPNHHDAAHRFNAALLKHFTDYLPCLTVKTGALYVEGVDGAGFPPLFNSISTGCPLLLVDMRSRKVRGDSRENALVDALDVQEKLCQSLRDRGTEDLMLSCLLAHLHDLFYSDQPYALYSRLDRSPSGLHAAPKAVPFVPIHEAIRRLEANGDEDDMPLLYNRKSQAFVEPEFARLRAAEVAKHILDFSQLYFKYRWELVPEVAKARLLSEAFEDLRGGGGKQDEDRAYLEVLATQVNTLYSKAEFLLTHPNVHCTNVEDVEGAKALIRALVRLDRLPSQEDYEGLMLLRDAWTEYDTKLYHAMRYKFLSKICYFALLCLGVLTVISTVLPNATDDLVQTLSEKIASKVWEIIVLTCAIISAMLVSLNTFVGPTQKWRRLRGCCCALESNIYQYRTRVKNFALSPVSNSAESAFRDYLMEWREGVAGGTDMKSSPIERRLPPKELKHFQLAGGESCSAGDDDFHSPLKPKDYINFRVKKMKQVYQRRLPIYSWLRFVLQAFVIVVSGIATAVVFFKLGSLVGILTAFTTSLTSWTQFADYQRKIERYTDAIQGLNNLQTWWMSLCEVEQSSLENVSRLVCDSEEIISKEFQSWSSVSVPNARDIKLTSSDVDVSKSNSQPAGGQDQPDV